MQRAVRFVAVAIATLASAALALAGSDRAAGPDPIAGRWIGTIAAPQGESAPIAFDFLAREDGRIGFKLTFPAMFTREADLGIPVERTAPGHYAIAPLFGIELELAEDRLAGTFGVGRLPLQLRRGEELPPPLPTIDARPGPAPLWQYALDAGTWAPPTVAGDTVYVGDAAGSFHAVDARDGTARWKWRGDAAIDGAATVQGETVYFLDTRLFLVALDRRSGNFRWRVPIHDAGIAGHPAPENPTFNHRAATPLLAGDTLYIGSSDGGIYAVDAATGEKRWRWPAGAPVYSTISRDGERLLFGTMDGSVVSLDPATQTEIARFRTGGGVVTTPVLCDGRIVVGSRDYQLYAFAPGRSDPVWRFAYWFSWVESTPALEQGLLYVGGSDYARVTAIDARTGRGEWSTVVGGMAWGTPLVTDDAVFIGTVNQNLPGTLIDHAAGLVKLDRASGEIIWRIPMPRAAAGDFAGYAGSLGRAGDSVIGAAFDGFLRAFPAR